MYNKKLYSSVVKSQVRDFIPLCYNNLVQSIIYFISFSIIIYWITNREDISIISGLIALCVLYIAKIYKNKKFLFEKYYNCKCYHKQNCSCWDYVEDGECDSCK